MDERLETGALLAEAVAALARAGVASPESDARWLWRHLTAWSGSDIVLRRRDPVDAQVASDFRGLVARRAAREPLQRITGTAAFRSLELTVAPGVFIPRPETEFLVEIALDGLPAGAVVVEPCTGTGAIAIAIATEAQVSRVVATDVSAAAVTCARDNARALDATVVEVRCGDLLDPLDEDLAGHVDLLVCNPPYLDDSQIPEAEPEVREGDPHEALSSGPTGHEITDRLIAAAGKWLAPDGRLVMEVDPSRAADVGRRCAATGLVGVEVHDDLTRRPRIVVARVDDSRR